MARHSGSPTTRYEPLHFDFSKFFSLFSLNSDVSLYLASLDLDAFLSNMEIAFLPSHLPPSEVSRARAAVLSDILAIERTFSIMERAGLDVAELKSCLTSARTVIVAQIARADREASPSSSPSSTTRSVSPSPRLHASGAGGPPPTGPPSHQNYDSAQPRHTLASESFAHHPPYYRPAAAPALRAYEPSHFTQHASPYKSTVTTTNSKLSFTSEWYPPMRS